MHTIRFERKTSLSMRCLDFLRSKCGYLEVSHPSWNLDDIFSSSVQFSKIYPQQVLSVAASNNRKGTPFFPKNLQIVLLTYFEEKIITPNLWRAFGNKRNGSWLICLVNKTLSKWTLLWLYIPPPPSKKKKGNLINIQITHRTNAKVFIVFGTTSLV